MPFTTPRFLLLDDVELGFGPVLEQLRPDVIHAHDSNTLQVAGRAADRLRAEGHSVKLVYDAHEHTAAATYGHAMARHDLLLAERRYVPQCDLVITVSETVAGILQKTHGLRTLPAVVTNAPRKSGRSVVSLRTSLGLDPETPLLVYVGGVAPARGLDCAISALTLLPGVHLALITKLNRGTLDALQLADHLGVADRVHRHDYVPIDAVPAFISSADIGIIPWLALPNHSVALPTKYREYVMAGLPIVASDHGQVSQEIQRTGVGRVFRTEDPGAFAVAVREVLAHPAQYRSALAQGSYETFTWEHQETILTKSYSEISPLRGDFPPRHSGTDVASSPAVLIGPGNNAGQANEWAKSLRAVGISATSIQVFSQDPIHAFEADVTIGEHVSGNREYLLDAFADLVPRHTHVLLEGARPIFRADAATIPDLDALRRSGLEVGLIFHGPEVRHPLRHANRYQWSPFSEPANSELANRLLDGVRKVHAALAWYDGVAFVSTPDLLLDVPWAKWLPVSVDMQKFASDDRDLAESNRPVVYCAPSSYSSRSTRRVDSTLRRLEESGVISCIRPRGMADGDLTALLHSADIVLNQFSFDAIGVTAIQAMASGRPVVAHLSDSAAGVYPERPPVVDATPETLEDVIVSLARDGDQRAHLGQAGRRYAARYHDGRRSAEVLRETLGLGPSRSG